MATQRSHEHATAVTVAAYSPAHDTMPSQTYQLWTIHCKILLFSLHQSAHSTRTVEGKPDRLISHMIVRHGRVEGVLNGVYKQHRYISVGRIPIVPECWLS